MVTREDLDELEGGLAEVIAEIEDRFECEIAALQMRLQMLEAALAEKEQPPLLQAAE